MRVDRAGLLALAKTTEDTQLLREIAEVLHDTGEREIARLEAAVALAERWQANYKLALERERVANQQLRRLGREAEMERDTVVHANELLREQLAAAEEPATDHGATCTCTLCLPPDVQ